MGEHTTALAAEIQGATGEFIDLIDELGNQEWNVQVAATGWPVGVTAHHLATSWDVATEFMRRIVDGSDLPEFPSGGVDSMNAEHARQFSRVTKHETLSALRTARDNALALVAGLSDDQLGIESPPMAVMGGATVTPEQFADLVIINHVADHKSAIEAALGRHSDVSIKVEGSPI